MRRSASVVASAPAYPNGHLILQSALRPELWPRDVATCSPMYAAATQIQGLGVSLAYNTDAPVDDRAVFYDSSGAYDLVSPFTIDSLQQLRHHALEQNQRYDDDKIDIYVCTHASRDCRCGIVGVAVYERLRAAVQRRRLSKKISVSQISHVRDPFPVRDFANWAPQVGGHRWAANVILYPAGHWLGLVKAEDADTLLDFVMKGPSSWAARRWRGRTGLTQAEIRTQAASLLATTGDVRATFVRGGKESLEALENPVAVRFQTSTGAVLETHGFEGETLKDVAKRAERVCFPGPRNRHVLIQHSLVEATCGGACECATCAVDLTGDGMPADLPPVSEEEQEQMTLAGVQGETKRLSCQIPLTEAFASWTARAGTVRIP